MKEGASESEDLPLELTAYMSPEKGLNCCLLEPDM